MSDRLVRWGGIAGVVFVVLILVTVFAPGEPPAGDDSVDQIREFMVDNRSMLLVANAVGLLAAPFVIWFFVVLRDVLRGDQIANALGTAMVLGMVLVTALAMAGGSVSVSAIYLDGAAEQLGDDTLRIVFEAQGLLFGATSAGLLLMSVTAAMAIRRTGALPMYTMWIAWLAAIGSLAGMASTLDAEMGAMGFFGLATLCLFVLVTGITMATGKAKAPVPAATTP